LALRANYDFLTRLLSRSGLYEQLRQTDDSGQPNVQSAGVMLVDIDYFKAVNDSFGHDSGDAVLQEIASRMRTVIGDQGMLCRFGGEEFMVVLFNHEQTALFRIAEQIRIAIFMRKFLLQGNTVSITVSIGIANEIRPQKSRVETVNTLISAADKQLYQAKRNGRNQTMQPIATAAEPIR